MRRVFWVALGATTAVLLVRQGRRVAGQLTPPALLASVADTVRGFAEEVRVGMAQREAELRDQLGLDSASGPDGSPEFSR